MALTSVPHTVRPLTELVAEEVGALMGRYKVHQTQLAGVMGISQTGVSKRLRGVIPFDANELGVIARFFGVDPAQLLGDPKAPQPSGPVEELDECAVRDLNPQPADIRHSSGLRAA